MAAFTSADIRGAVAAQHAKGRSSTYRADIDGLRAVAVSCVLLFHAFPSAFPGGFVGVDVFFVISGFLITGIIRRAMSEGTFSYLDFYGRRVRRLLPGLLAMIAGTLAIGFVYLPPEDLRYLGKSLVGAATFLSNVQFWKEINYFDLDNDIKPFLHLWSLGVEEQFYIVWPVILQFALFRRWRVSRCILILAAASFAFNIWCVLEADGASAFFLTPSRGWELLSGAFISSSKIESRRLANIASAIGFALIAASFMLLRPNEAYPGVQALLPVTGALMILLAGPRSAINRTVLSNGIATWVGRISYPLYLWHWPLLAIATIHFGGLESVAMRLALLYASFILAALTHVLIERPIMARGSERTARRFPMLEASLLGGLALSGIGGYALFKTTGLPHRFSPDEAAYLDFFENRHPEYRYWAHERIREKLRDECNFFDIAALRAGRSVANPRPSLSPDCTQPPPSAHHVVMLWGDSHAQHLSYGLMQHLPQDFALLQVASSGCSPSLDGDPFRRPVCIRSNEFALETIKKTKPETVILAQRRGHDLPTLRRIAKELQLIGVPRVIVMGPVPQWKPDLYKVVALNHHMAPPEFLKSHHYPGVIAANAALTRGMRPGEPFTLVDVHGFFCSTAGCRVSIDGDLRSGLVTGDYGHLSPAASEYLARQLLVPLITGRPKQS